MPHSSQGKRGTRGAQRGGTRQQEQQGQKGWWGQHLPDPISCIFLHQPNASGRGRRKNSCSTAAGKYSWPIPPLSLLLPLPGPPGGRVGLPLRPYRYAHSYKKNNRHKLIKRKFDSEYRDTNKGTKHWNNTCCKLCSHTNPLKLITHNFLYCWIIQLHLQLCGAPQSMQQVQLRCYSGETAHLWDIIFYSQNIP